MFNKRKELNHMKYMYKASIVSLNVEESKNDDLKNQIKLLQEDNKKAEEILEMRNKENKKLEEANEMNIEAIRYLIEKIVDLENNLDFVTNNLTPLKRAKIGR